MSSVLRSGVVLMPLLVALGACTVNMTAPAETTQPETATSSASVPAPARIPESAALLGARKKVKDMEWEIGKAESALRQLSPPIRITDSKGTTFNADKQRTYEKDRARVDRQIRDLKDEKLVWELRVNQLVLAAPN